MAITDYSTNPDNNGIVAGKPYFPPGMLANALAPAERQVMADIAAAIGGGAATAILVFTGTAANAYVTPAAIKAASAPVTLADGNTITPQNGFNFTVTLGALASGTRTLANPVGFFAGQSGVIELVQDATGGRTIASYGSFYDFGVFGKPTLSTAPNAVDVLNYYVTTSGKLRCSFINGFAT